MKQLIILLSTLLITSYSFASSPSSNINQALSSAWKSQQSMHVQLDKHDLAMVYGGKDLRPSFVQNATVV